MGDYWVHDLDPVIFRIGPLSIRWYGLAYLLGILAGWWLLRRWARQGRLPLSDADVGNAVFYLAVGMIVGGRLGYALIYAPDLIIGFRATPPWWDLLALHEGGMASHGGIVGLLAGTWLFARRHDVNLWSMADAVATVAPIGIALGRFANFINGELWGRVTSVPWAIIFPQADLQPRHPYQLYAVLLEGLFPLAVGLTTYGLHRRPGLNAGLVLVAYSVGRFTGEFFREIQHGVFLEFLSRGQLLTLPVLAVGVYLVARALRRPPRDEANTRDASRGLTFLSPLKPAGGTLVHRRRIARRGTCFLVVAFIGNDEPPRSPHRRPDHARRDGTLRCGDGLGCDVQPDDGHERGGGGPAACSRITCFSSSR